MMKKFLKFIGRHKELFVPDISINNKELKENIFAYKMDRKSSIDIYEELDFKIARALLD